MNAFDGFFSMLGEMKFANPHLLWLMLVIRLGCQGQ